MPPDAPGRRVPREAHLVKVDLSSLQWVIL